MNDENNMILAFRSAILRKNWHITSGCSIFSTPTNRHFRTPNQPKQATNGPEELDLLGLLGELDLLDLLERLDLLGLLGLLGLLDLLDELEELVSSVAAAGVRHFFFDTSLGEKTSFGISYKFHQSAIYLMAESNSYVT